MIDVFLTVATVTLGLASALLVFEIRGRVRGERVAAAAEEEPDGASLVQQAIDRLNGIGD